MNAEQPPGLMQTIKDWLGLKNGNGSARNMLEELIEEREEAAVPIDDDERALLVNILELRGRTVRDVMVPRADVISVDEETGLRDVVDLMTSKGHSRLPVYRDTLDGAIGMAHIKDVMAWRGRDADFRLSGIVRAVLFMPPSMRVLELLLEMRITRCHMALVVDEYGGVDGLVTIEDLVEEIVGEIEDEHDRAVDPVILEDSDGSLIADARVTIKTLEDRIGAFASDEEREDTDTLGGLVFSLAGRVPALGELIVHPSGLEFEVEDADPRRIKRLRLRGIGSVAPTLVAES